MKNAYVSTFLEFWGAITLQVIQMRNYRIRFAWNWCPGPLIRITRHFQYDPLQPNKETKQMNAQFCIEQELFIFKWWTVKSFD